MKKKEMVALVQNMINTLGSDQRDLICKTAAANMSQSEFDSIWDELTAPVGHDPKDLSGDFPAKQEVGGKLRPTPDSYKNFCYFIDQLGWAPQKILGVTVVYDESIEQYVAMQQIHFNQLISLLSDSAFKCSEGKIQSFLETMATENSDVWMEEYRNVKWDGKDHIRDLYDRLHSKSEDDFEFLAFKKAIHGYVAMALLLPSPDDQEPRNEIMIILIGPEGRGKTAWCRLLLPDLPIQLYHEGCIKGEKDKDNTFLTSEVLIWIVSEVDATFNKYGIASFKDFISKKVSKERRSYGRYAEHVKKRCTFVGSTNEKRFLPPGEELRRVMCIEIEDLIDYTTPLNVKQLFAQVVHERGEGFCNWFTIEEIQQNKERNQRWVKHDSLNKWLEILEVIDPTHDEEGKEIKSSFPVTDFDLWQHYNTFCRMHNLTHSSSASWENRLVGCGFRKARSIREKRWNVRFKEEQELGGEEVNL